MTYPVRRHSPLKTWNGHDHSGVGTMLAMTSLRRWPPFRDKIASSGSNPNSPPWAARPKLCIDLNTFAFLMRADTHVVPATPCCIGLRKTS
jgi:hypothetical protein